MLVQSWLKKIRGVAIQSDSNLKPAKFSSLSIEFNELNNEREIQLHQLHFSSDSLDFKSLLCGQMEGITFSTI